MEEEIKREENVQYGEVNNYSPLPVNDDNNPKKKKTGLVILIGIVVLLALGAAAWFFWGNALRGTPGFYEDTVISAVIKDDGTAVIPTPDGDLITIKEEVKTAVLTKDKKNIIVLLKDGLLYVTDRKNTTKKEIAEDAASIYNIRNDGFVYEDENDNCYRVLLSDQSVVEMGKDVAYITAPQTISMLYADDKDNIYSLKSDSNSPQKIGTYSDTVNLKTITDDGNIAVWTVSEGKNRTIVLSENGDNSVLDEFESNYDGVYVRYTKDQKLLVVVNIFGEEIWLKEPNKEHVRVKLGNEISSIVVYAPNGELQNQTISSVKSIYVIVDGDTDYNIYNISLDGEKERILSKVKKFAIGNGYVFYTNSDQDLYSAKIKETKIEDETKIASDVGTFDLAGNGKYLYYFRDCEDDYGSLYALKLGEKDPKKVSSDVYYDYTSLYGVYTYSYNRYSTDGATVYYWKDAESILDTYTDYGTLMKWNYSTEKAEKVASDVIVSSVSSYLTNYGINPKKIVFSKYNSKDKDGTIIVDVMSYNGSEVSKIISEAKR